MKKKKKLSQMTGLSARLQYVFGKQDWETMAKSFWIRQALDMMLSIVKVMTN